MEQIAKALELKMELDALRPLDKEQEAIVMQKLRLDWDYHSNHLEGNSLSYGETKALIMFGITAQGKPLKDHVEITGHDEVIKTIIEIVKDEFPLTEKFIRELHELLLKEPYKGKAITPDGKKTSKTIEIGKYKTQTNHVVTQTGEIFRFATPEETPAKMQELIEWYNKNSEARDKNPVILAAEFHYRFIRIHPFDDGNGRIARILMNFILMKFGFPPAIIKTEDKSNYFAALQQADSGIIEPFFDYIAANLVRSLEIMIAGAKGESIEEPDDLDKEIALLEQKLKAVGKEVKVTKSYDAVHNVYENSIEPLNNRFIDISKKFTHFYIESNYNVEVFEVNTGILEKLTDLFLAKPHLNGTTSKLSLRYVFSIFSQSGFGDFSYPSIIDVDFKVSTYIISTSSISIEHLYDEQLTEKEINELVQREARRHMDFITQKLKDAQNKTN